MLSEVVNDLKALKLGPMAARLNDWVADPANQGKSHLDCVSALALAQIQSRTNKRIFARLKKAGLPTVSLRDGQQKAFWGVPAGLLGNLATCDWIGLGHSVVITGASYSGKTTLAAALLREAVQQGKSAAYWRVPELLTACAIESQRGPAAVSVFLKRQAKPELLVLDDFAVEVSDRPQCYGLRQLLDERARRNRAIMIVSPNEIDHWKDYFEDSTAAEAIFARVLSKLRPVSLTRPTHPTR